MVGHMRTNDPVFMRFVRSWWQELLPRMKPLLFSHGGPILMVQIENEYGFRTFLREQPYLKVHPSSPAHDCLSVLCLPMVRPLAAACPGSSCCRDAAGALTANALLFVLQPSVTYSRACMCPFLGPTLAVCVRIGRP